MRILRSVILVAVVGFALGGCAQLDRWGLAASGEDIDGPGLDSKEERAVNVAEKGAPYLPSPWREVIIGLLGGLTAFTYAKKSQKKGA